MWPPYTVQLKAVAWSFQAGLMFAHKNNKNMDTAAFSRCTIAVAS